MQSYLVPLISLFQENANSTQAGPMKKYMRDQFEYLGIKSPQFKVLFRNFINEHGLPPFSDLDLIVRDLWNLPEREFQYLAVGFVGRLENQLSSTFIRTIEYMIIHKSWWDTVDSIAGDTVGIHFQPLSRYTREISFQMAHLG